MGDPGAIRTGAIRTGVAVLTRTGVAVLTSIVIRRGVTLRRF